MPMAYIPEIGAENRYHKPARKYSTILFVTRNRYQKKLLPNYMSDASVNRNGFLLPVLAPISGLCVTGIRSLEFVIKYCF